MKEWVEERVEGNESIDRGDFNARTERTRRESREEEEQGGTERTRKEDRKIGRKLMGKVENYVGF